MRYLLRQVPPPASLIVPVPDTSLGDDEAAFRLVRLAYAVATVGMLHLPILPLTGEDTVSPLWRADETDEKNAPLLDGTGTLFPTEDVGTRILVHTTGELRDFYWGYPSYIATVAILRNRRFLACFEEQIVGWQLPSDREFLLEGHTALVRGVIGLPDGRHALSGSEDGTARLWDTDTRTEVARFTAAAPVVGVAAWPDGTLVVADEKQAVYFLRLESEDE